MADNTKRIATSFWRNYVKMTSFWRNNDVIIALCVCWVDDGFRLIHHSWKAIC